MDNQALVFSKVNWSPEVAASLSKATEPETAFIAAEVKAGICECWCIEGCGYMVTRLEVEPDHKTLVMIAGQGKRYLEVMAKMPAIARANGAKNIRVHFRRAGIARWLERLNYKIEYGLGENVAYGRF